MCSAIWNHKHKILNRLFQPKRASEDPQLVGSKSSVPDRPKSWSCCICPEPEASYQPHARRTAGRSTRTRSRSGIGSRVSREIVYSRSRRVALEFSQRDPESNPCAFEDLGIHISHSALPLWS